MPDSLSAETQLIERVRAGDQQAWQSLIEMYEGRLLAFAESRLGRRAAAEDVVQETFVGFLISLPNFDGRRAVEGYLFSICAHKLTDQLRREGRRPALSLAAGDESECEIPGSARPASSLARSGERRQLEETALVAALREQALRWREKGDWAKLACIELLFVRGWANKEVAQCLAISEQQVANTKFEFLARLRQVVRRQGLSDEVFPELAAE